MKISCIIPVYNAAEYLADCIDSVLSSSYKNIELIFVDDGSTDNSLDILSKFLINDKCILLHSSNNGSNVGAAFARNHGLKHASGDIVHFMDADDYVQKDFFSLLIDAIIKYDADVSVGSLYYERTAYLNSVRPFLYRSKLGRLSCNPGLMNSACVYLFKRDFLSQHPELLFQPIKFGEDTLFVIQALCCAKKVISVPEAVYMYTYNPNSSSRLINDEEKLSLQLHVGRLLDEISIKYNIPPEIWKKYLSHCYAIQEKHCDDIVSRPQKSSYIKRMVKKLLGGVAYGRQY